MADPYPGEAELCRDMRRERIAFDSGWRFRCERVAARKRSYLVTVYRPDGVATEIIGRPQGLSAYLSQIEGRAAVVRWASPM